LEPLGGLLVQVYLSATLSLLVGVVVLGVMAVVLPQALEVAVLAVIELVQHP